MFSQCGIEPGRTPEENEIRIRRAYGETQPAESFRQILPFAFDQPDCVFEIFGLPQSCRDSRLCENRNIPGLDGTGHRGKQGLIRTETIPDPDSGQGKAFGECLQDEKIGMILQLLVQVCLPAGKVQKTGIQEKTYSGKFA